MKRYKSSLIIFSILSAGILTACKKAVEVPPPVTGLTGSSVYTTNATAVAVLTGLYDRISSNPSFCGYGGLDVMAGLSADELKLYYNSPALQALYSNSLTDVAPAVPGIWKTLYQYIYDCNAALQGLSNSTAVTAPVKQQLIGEAKFMRALLYFYAVNFYGDVPLLTTPDYQTAAVAGQTPKAQVYQQMIADLLDAENKLNTNFVGSDALTKTVERTRPTKWAAAALLARTYLYTSKWDSAAAQASLVIGQSGTFRKTGLDSVFLKNSSEAIFQLANTNPALNTWVGNTFILARAPSIVSTSPVALSSQLIGAFETGDARLVHWVKDTTITGTAYAYAYKYKVKGNTGVSIPSTEYLTVLRLAEVYLIRAEAEAQSNDLTDAATDLNWVRQRAALGATTAVTQTDLLAAILHERQVELFTEFGHRWFDLKRTGNADAVMGPVCTAKNGTWNTNWELYPVPQTDLLVDHNLSQNPGYSY